MKTDDDSLGQYNAYMTASTVQNTINKYFGFKIQNQSIPYHEYINGKYIIPLADGEQYANFTQVKEICKNGNVLDIVADIYTPDDYNDLIGDDSWRYYPIDRKSTDYDIILVETVEAKVKLVNGKYELIQYDILEK